MTTEYATRILQKYSHGIDILKKKVYWPHFVATSCGPIGLQVYCPSFLIERNVKTLDNEGEYIRTLLENTNDTDLVLDCGGNVGLHAMIFATKAKEVVCLEPAQEFANIIASNLKRNRIHNVVVINKAVMATPGPISLQSGNSEYKSPRINGMTDSRDKYRKFGRVQTVDGVSLDQLCNNSESSIGHPNVVIIDVEGCEYLALQGGKELFSGPNKPRVIGIEIHVGYLKSQGLTPESVKNLLENFGYSQIFSKERGLEIHKIFALPQDLRQV